MRSLDELIALVRQSKRNVYARGIQVLYRTTSTMDRMEEYARDGSVEELFKVIALIQTHGRGARVVVGDTVITRPWYNGALNDEEVDGNLKMSLALKPHPFECFQIGEASAMLATLRVTRAHINGDVDVRARWPNDLMVDGRKAGGHIIFPTLRTPPLFNLGIGINFASIPEIRPSDPPHTQEKENTIPSEPNFKQSMTHLSAHGMRLSMGQFVEAFEAELRSIRSDLAHQEDFTPYLIELGFADPQTGIMHFRSNNPKDDEITGRFKAFNAIPNKSELIPVIELDQNGKTIILELHGARKPLSFLAPTRPPSWDSALNPEEPPLT